MEKVHTWIEDNLDKFSIWDIYPCLPKEIQDAVWTNKKVNHDKVDGDERHERFISKLVNEYLMDMAEKIVLNKQRSMRIKKYKRYLEIINSSAENVHKNIAIDKLIESEYHYFWYSELRTNLQQIAV